MTSQLSIFNRKSWRPGCKFIPPPSFPPAGSRKHTVTKQTDTGTRANTHTAQTHHKCVAQIQSRWVGWFEEPGDGGGGGGLCRVGGHQSVISNKPGALEPRQVTDTGQRHACSASSCRHRNPTVVFLLISPQINDPSE